MEKVKKERQPNFTHDEINILIDEVEQSKDVLFSSFSSTLDNNKKQKGWELISHKINANSNFKRGKEQVRKKWQDLQAAAKKKEQNRRKEIQMTGGGSSPKDLTQTEQKIIAIMPQTLIEGISGGIDTHTQAGTSKSERTSSETAGTSKSQRTSIDLETLGNSKSKKTCTETVMTVGTAKSDSKEVTQLSLLGKAKAMTVEIQHFLQEYRPSTFLPKVGDIFNNYKDTTKCITEDERDDLTSFLSSFKEINFSVLDVPTMVHDTISFIVHYSDKTVAKEVDNGLIAIGLAAEPIEEATCHNQSAEGSRIKDDHYKSPNKRKKERNDTEKGNETNSGKLVKIEEQKFLLKKRKIEILERILLIEEEKLNILKQQQNETNIANATNIAMELLSQNI